MKCGDKEHESQKASESESMMNKKKTMPTLHEYLH